MLQFSNTLQNKNPDLNHVFDANLSSGSDFQTFFQTNSLSNQTRFFRNRELFDGIVDTVFPELVNIKNGKNQKLRVWSAGCSDGREAYSLAMVFHKTLMERHLNEQVSVSIIASDINVARIETGRRGIYSLTDDEIRDLKPYFNYLKNVDDGNNWQVDPVIQRMVQFKAEDIFKHNTMTPYDFLVCTNVLLYYEKEFRKSLLVSIMRHLRDNGLVYMESLGNRYLKSVGIDRIGPHLHYYQKLNEENIRR